MSLFQPFRSRNPIISNKPYSIQAPENHTLFPYNDTRPSTVDFAIIKNICNFKSIEALNDLDSDHHPIIITLNKNRIITNYRTFLKYKNANWKMYREHMNPIVNKLQTKRHRKYRGER